MEVVLLLVILNVSGKLLVLNIIIGFRVMCCWWRFILGSGLWFGSVGLIWIFIYLFLWMIVVNSCSCLYVWFCLFFRWVWGRLDLSILCWIRLLLIVFILLVMVFRNFVCFFGDNVWYLMFVDLVSVYVWLILVKLLLVYFGFSCLLVVGLIVMMGVLVVKKVFWLISCWFFGCIVLFFWIWFEWIIKCFG